MKEEWKRQHDRRMEAWRIAQQFFIDRIKAGLEDKCIKLRDAIARWFDERGITNIDPEEELRRLVDGNPGEPDWFYRAEIFAAEIWQLPLR